MGPQIRFQRFGLADRGDRLVGGRAEGIAVGREDFHQHQRHVEFGAWPGRGAGVIGGDGLRQRVGIGRHCRHLADVEAVVVPAPVSRIDRRKASDGSGEGPAVGRRLARSNAFDQALEPASAAAAALIGIGKSSAERHLEAAAQVADPPQGAGEKIGRAGAADALADIAFIADTDRLHGFVETAGHRIEDAGDELREVPADGLGRGVEAVVRRRRRTVPGIAIVAQEVVGDRDHDLQLERAGMVEKADMIAASRLRRRGATRHVPVIEPHQGEAEAGGGREVVAAAAIAAAPQRREGVIGEVGIGRLRAGRAGNPTRPGRAVGDAAPDPTGAPGGGTGSNGPRQSACPGRRQKPTAQQRHVRSNISSR